VNTDLLYPAAAILFTAIGLSASFILPRLSARKERQRIESVSGRVESARLEGTYATVEQPFRSGAVEPSSPPNMAKAFQPEGHVDGLRNFAKIKKRRAARVASSRYSLAPALFGVVVLGLTATSFAFLHQAVNVGSSEPPILGSTDPLPTPGAGPTVTVTSSPSTASDAPTAGSRGEYHLADSGGVPGDILVDNDLESVENLQMDGRRYHFAWISQRYSDDAEALVGINVNQSYRTFSAVLGLSALSQNGEGRIRLVADGRVVKVCVVSLSKSCNVNISTRGVQRLEIRASPVGSDRLIYAIGDPVITS
jgi:hypothetical protein